MEQFSNFIIKNKKKVIAIFIVAALFCVLLQFFVGVNYNMVDYLPENAPSTKALAIMNKEFTQTLPNANVMIKDISIVQALDYKEKLSAVPGVLNVMWLDDVMDVMEPLEMGDKATIESYYKNSNALFSVAIAKGMEKDTTKAIQDLIGEENAVAGEAPNLATVQTATMSEVMNALIILLPVVVLILMLSSTSWIEPLLFFANIGVAILINMGTNIFLGEVSFMTNSVSPILQLACSLDYGIFLLHSFASNRKKYDDPEVAMKQSMKESVTTVAASAATTLFGFLALMFMNFRIGGDLGLNLAKGIVISFITSMMFLPALTLALYKLIDKTKHREFLPSFKNVHKGLSKLAIPLVILVIILLVPSFLGQNRTEFAYGNAGADLESRTGRDSVAIKEEFGQSTPMVLLVPKGDVAKEYELCEELKEIDYVKSIMSYATTVGTTIPPEYLGDEITSQFYSENYARIIVYLNTPEEGDIAFNTVENIQNKIAGYYPDDSHSLGQSTNLYDMKNVVQKDNTLVNLIAIIAIFAVLIVSFKSATLPFILLLTIETGIWINLAIPYFTGTTINFMGYLVVSTVQLGATVDYAILLTDHYVRYRKEMPQKKAIRKSLGDSFKSILVSGSTLSLAGFTLFATSSNAAISDIGLLLGRGTLLSMLMVLCFLPTMLTVFDKAINKTTYKAQFFEQKEYVDSSVGGIK